MKLLQFTRYIFVFLCISIGLYPLIYLFADMSKGLLGTKSMETLSSNFYMISFYVHISFGGVALLTGWSQFVTTFRQRNLNRHRLLGKVYIVSVLISGINGLYIAFYATGGPPSILGFFILAILWLTTTGMAYRSIINKKLVEHEQWMIRSYSLTFAAVMLRLWMPVLIGLFGMDFFEAYPIIAWLCWVPNLAVAEFLFVRKIRP